MRKTGLLIALALAAASVQAATLKEDTQELRLSGLLDPDTAGGTLFRAGVSYGYFVADNFQVGGSLRFSDDDQSTGVGLGPFVEYNFDYGSQLIPFVGASLEYGHGEVGDVSSDAVVFGGNGGARFFLTENVAIGARLALDWATDEIYADDGDTTDVDIRLELGMSCYVY
jgi:hypothetical protein